MNLNSYDIEAAFIIIQMIWLVVFLFLYNIGKGEETEISEKYAKYVKIHTIIFWLIFVIFVALMFSTR